MSCQAAHAAIQFQHDHPELSYNWYHKSNYLVFLSVKNESDLIHIQSQLRELNVEFSAFTEPDLDDQLTAIAFLSDEKTKTITSGLPLLLKEVKKEKILV
jgi:hypothetical protein